MLSRATDPGSYTHTRLDYHATVRELPSQERPRAEVLQAFARALVAGQLAHGGVVVQPGASIGVGVGFAGEHGQLSSLYRALDLPHQFRKRRAKGEV